MCATFHWDTGRNEVASWKNVPQDAVDLVAWWQRMQDLYATDEPPPSPRSRESLAELGSDRLRQLGAKYHAEYMIDRIPPPRARECPVSSDRRGTVARQRSKQCGRGNAARLAGDVPQSFVRDLSLAMNRDLPQQLAERLAVPRSAPTLIRATTCGRGRGIWASRPTTPGPLRCCCCSIRVKAIGTCRSRCGQRIWPTTRGKSVCRAARLSRGRRRLRRRFASFTRSLATTASRSACWDRSRRPTCTAATTW